jgi:hypothetical protein
MGVTKRVVGVVVLLLTVVLLLAPVPMIQPVCLKRMYRLGKARLFVRRAAKLA